MSNTDSLGSGPKESVFDMLDMKLNNKLEWDSIINFN